MLAAISNYGLVNRNRKNIEDAVIGLQERFIFNALSLVEYKRHREKRGLPPLTKWQEKQLTLERIAAAMAGL